MTHKIPWEWLGDFLPGLRPGGSLEPLNLALRHLAAGQVKSTTRAKLRLVPRAGEESATRTLSLDGTWRYCASADDPSFGHTELDDRAWPTMALPANWYLAGLDHHGVVWFRRTVEVPADLKGQRYWLRFEGVDYFAQVWLNGVHLGNHEGYFQPFEFDVTDLVRPGEEHVVAVRVDSPYEEYGRVWHMRKTLVKGIFGHHDCRPGGGWGPRGQEGNTGGIWRHVSLLATSEARITRAHVTPVLEEDHRRATLHLDLTVHHAGKRARSATVDAVVRPHNFIPDAGEPEEVPLRAKVRLTPGENRVRLSATLEQSRLWWTWDQGQPHLYAASVRLEGSAGALDEHDVTFGIRTIRRDEDWTWYLNGRRVFLRGSNYIPTQWLAEMDEARFERDVQLMRKANLNTIRVHAHVNREEFYRVTDAAGILVWQDFALQWGYADTEEFAQSALRQQDEMIDLLSNHPSIAVWCCHNESPWDAPWLQYKVPDYDPEQNRALDQRLYAAASRKDPTRVIHMSSGTGDGHPYPGWFHSPSYWDFKDLPGAPFVTEYGAQALPNLETMQRMLAPDDLWPPRWEAWEFHDFQPKECFEMAGVPMGDSLEEFIANTQDYQARLIQFATETYRRAKYAPMTGVFQFMFVDPWPAITWAVLDAYRTPKRGFEALRRAMQPVLPSVVYTGDRFPAGTPFTLDLWVVNDLPRPFMDATLRWCLIGRGLQPVHGQQRVDLTPDSSQRVTALTADLDLAPGSYCLELRLEDVEGRLLGDNEFTFTVVEAASTS